jgi:hypothetical protein
MSWSDLVPSIIAFVGIPAGVYLRWWLNNKSRQEQEVRDEKLRSELYAREDQQDRQHYADWVKQQWWQRNDLPPRKLVQG